MGKNKDGSRFVNKEIFQRVNFLYQAAQLVFRQDPTNYDMCRHYISTMRMVAEKHVIRIHPKMKRTFCKCCNVLLVSGHTCRIRSRSKSEKHTVVTCLLCGTIKRFMWRKSHRLWMDQPEAWLNAGGKPDNAGGKPDNAGGKPDNAGGKPDNAGGKPDNAGGKPDNAGGKPDNAGGKPDNTS